ncbi:MAG: GntR family transcriptional regulator YhfZ [Mycobacterium leprae]
MMHRYGSVAADLALRLLAMAPGDRLDSVGNLAAAFGTGRGTVQSALQLLQREEAVVLESRGSLGSFVTRLDQQKLLTLAGLIPLIGVMPVPYSLRFQGLATGLNRAFARADLPLVLAHLRGAKNRLHFLRTGRCDFAVISRLAWEEEQAQGDLRQVAAFGPGSNVGNHVLLLTAGAREGIADGMRVGVDASSHDHLRLTMQECQGKQVELVPISYAEAMPRLLAGEIEAALWDAGVPLPPGSPLVIQSRQQSLPSDDTEAVLVTRLEPPTLGNLIAARLDAALVREVQERVAAGLETPTF